MAPRDVKVVGGILIGVTVAALGAVIAAGVLTNNNVQNYGKNKSLDTAVAVIILLLIIAIIIAVAVALIFCYRKPKP